MNIVVAVKVVPDDQDIQVTASGELDMSKAHQTISAYDINAIEAAAQLAASVGDAKVTVVTVGPTAIDDSKLKKNILARGADELVMVADDACADMDACATAKMLASAINGLDGWDLIICGDGSADNYAQQVDGWACLSPPRPSRSLRQVPVCPQSASLRMSSRPSSFPCRALSLFCPTSPFREFPA